MERRRALSPDEPFDVICLSLEPWDEVWRRNQHLASQHAASPAVPAPAVRGEPGRHRRGHSDMGASPNWCRSVPSATPGRLWAMAPHKWLPRGVWPAGGPLPLPSGGQGRPPPGLRPPGALDQRQHLRPPGRVGAAGRASTTSPTTGSWPRGPLAEMERQQRNDARLLRDASEVVVCSPALAESRGRHREVHLIPNGVDVDDPPGPDGTSGLTSRPGGSCCTRAP